MRKQLSYNITYNGSILFSDLTEDECQHQLLLLAEKAADDTINPELIDVEIH